MIYDGFLLIAIILVAVTAVTIPVNLLLGADGLTGLLQNPLWKLLFQAYLAGVSMLFYVWFWCRGGQTLGMKVWKIRLVDQQGNPVTTQQAWRRVFWAVVTLTPLGIGLLWSLFSQIGRAHV